MQNIMRSCGRIHQQELWRNTFFMEQDINIIRAFCEEKLIIENMMIYFQWPQYRKIQILSGKILSGRMLMPYGISDFAWMQYEGYVKQHQCEMMNYLKEEDQMPFISLWQKKIILQKMGLEAAID